MDCGDLVWKTTSFARFGPTQWAETERMNAQEEGQSRKSPNREPNAAGADIGATQIFVTVPPDRDPGLGRCFNTLTADLEKLADWLQQWQVHTIAMESIGVYWILFHRETQDRSSARKTRVT
jgi:hypothetical protein